MILALIRASAMKLLGLGEPWVCKRMKAMRFRLIKLPTEVVVDYGLRNNLTAGN